MNQTLGIIGAAGDLGGQLRDKASEHGFAVLSCDPVLPDSVSLQTVFAEASIVHICAPLDELGGIPPMRQDTMTILHDSVMSTSRAFSSRRLEGSAAIVHMLMNTHQTAIVASDAPLAARASEHLTRLGCEVRQMTVDQHDLLMARSQAPLALLVATLLPGLYEQQAAGCLTNSGEVLADILRSRENAWTPATVRSILTNPQLDVVLEEMKNAREKVRYTNTND